MVRGVVRREKPQNYLLVEGKNDFHVICSLLEHYNVPELFSVEDKEGIERLLEAFEVELIRIEVEKLGVIIDSDADLLACWQQLKTILKNSGYHTVPTNPNLGGAVIKENGLPVVGIWLMPNNKIPGMLEDFVSLLVPENDLLWPMADTILQQVMQQECRFPQNHRIKAHIHTWLAWQEEPGKPLGQALTARYLDANSPHAQELITWIRKLFDLSVNEAI